MIVRSLLTLLMVIALFHPANAAESQAMSAAQITSRLATLTKEYKKLDTQVQKISTFADEAESERASIDTLARLLPVMTTIRAEIDDLLEQTAALTGGVELAKFEIKANEKTYDGPALSGPVADGDIIAFSAIVPMNGTVAEGQLKWVILNPEGNPVMGAEKTKKITETEGSMTAKFRLQLAGLQPGRYAARLTHSVEDKKIKPVTETYAFNIGTAQTVSISRLWVTDQPKNETHFGILQPDQAPVLYVSFDMNNGLEAVHKKLVVRERSSGIIVASSEGKKTRKGNSPSQRTGIALSAGDLKPGGRYRFEATLKIPGGESVSGSQTFEIAQAEVANQEAQEGDEVPDEVSEVKSQEVGFSPINDQDENNEEITEPNFNGFVKETNSNEKAPAVISSKQEQTAPTTRNNTTASATRRHEQPVKKGARPKNSSRVSPPARTKTQPRETSNRAQMASTQRTAPKRHPNWNACRSAVKDQNKAVKAHDKLIKRAFELNKVFHNKVRSEGKAINRRLKPIENVSADQYAEIQKLKTKQKNQKLTKQEIRYGNDLIAKHKISYNQVKSLRADRDKLKAFLKKFAADYKTLDCGVFAVNIKNSPIGKKYGYNYQPVYDVCNQLKFPKMNINRAKLTLQSLSCLNSSGQLKNEFRNTRVASNSGQGENGKADQDKSNKSQKKKSTKCHRDKQCWLVQKFGINPSKKSWDMHDGTPALVVLSCKAVISNAIPKVGFAGQIMPKANEYSGGRLYWRYKTVARKVEHPESEEESVCNGRKFASDGGSNLGRPDASRKRNGPMGFAENQKNPRKREYFLAHMNIY